MIKLAAQIQVIYVGIMIWLIGRLLEAASKVDKVIQQELVALPEVFERHALVPSAPLSLDPAAIDAGREAWIREWTDIVLR